MTTWKLIARFAARPAVANWLIRRAMKTPYSHLPSNDEPTYMARYWLFNPYPISSEHRKRWSFPWSIRIHHIKRKDGDRDLHDHPFNARTIILKGWYSEKRLITGAEREARLAAIPENAIFARAAIDKAEMSEHFLRQEGDTSKIGFQQYHQITDVSEGGVWTLFISGPWRGVWGFLVDGAKVPHKTYLGEEPDLSSDPVIQDVAADYSARPMKAQAVELDGEPWLIGRGVTDPLYIRSEELPIPERNFDPTMRYNGGPTAEDDAMQVEIDLDDGPAMPSVTELRDAIVKENAGFDAVEKALQKIRLNTGMFPTDAAAIGLSIYRNDLKLTPEARLAQKLRLNADFRFTPVATNLPELLKDIEALEAIYERNPQLEAYIGKEFKIRDRDRDDEGVFEPIKYTFGHPDNTPDDFARLVQQSQDQRHPRTPREWAKQFNPNHEFGNLGWDGQKKDCEKLRIADQRGPKGEYRPIYHPLDSIAEWRKGCSCAPNDPADCNECTTALIDSIEGWFHQHGGPHK